MTLRQKLLTVTGSLLVGVVLAMAMGEIVLRFFHPANVRLQNNKILLPVHRTYKYHNTRLRGCDPEIINHRNSLGFRGPDLSSDFQYELTLVAVGGSTTECFYLSDGLSWPEQMNAALQPRFHPLWVNNAGLDGHSTFGHQVLMREFIIPLRPKGVLFLVGLNDIGRDDLMPSDRRFMRHARDNSVFKQIFRRIGEKSRMFGWIQNLGRTWVASRRGLIHDSIDVRSLSKVEISETRQEAVLRSHARFVKGYQQRLEDLVRLCQEAHIQPVLITQPALYGSGKDPATGVNLETIQVEAMNGRLAWRVLELYNDVTRHLARDQHLPLIDLARTMGKSSDYYYDFHHFTNAGAAEVGRIVARDITPFLAKTYPAYLIKQK